MNIGVAENHQGRFHCRIVAVTQDNSLWSKSAACKYEQYVTMEGYSRLLKIQEK